MSEWGYSSPFVGANMLNTKQQEAYDKVMSIKDGEIIFINGEAGTGKSFLINAISSGYDGDVIISATTNKAKNNLIESTAKRCYTIHSVLGFILVGDSLIKKYKHIPTDLLIIDEVSMLTKQVWDEAIKYYTKIVLVGDTYQLKGIGTLPKISPTYTITLTEQMRQQDSTLELMEYFKNIRTSIDTTRISKDIQSPSNVCKYADFKSFVKAYKECKSDKKILAYTNQVVDKYNTAINNGIRYKVGDTIVLDKPIGKYANGDTAEILRIDEYEDYNRLTISGNEHIFHYRNNMSNNEHSDRICNPKLLYACTIHKAQGITVDEVFIDIRDILSQLHKKQTQFSPSPPLTIDEYLRLIYVAISRMKYKAHLFVGTTRNYKLLKGSYE